MLDSLSTRLQSIFDRLGGHGRLTEENIQEALREIRVALLEADVNFKVVRTFIDRVREKAVGQDVLRSLTPAQQVVKVVHDELVELLGGSGHRLAPAPHPPTVIMLIGLQGSGKTTTAAKLARWYTKQGQHPLLAAADTNRPAAQDQLQTLGGELGVPVVGGPGQTPLAICRQARQDAAARPSPSARYRAGRSRSRGRAKRSTRSSRSTPTGSPRASSAWATCSPSSSAPRRPWTRPRPRSSYGSSARTRSRSTTSATSSARCASSARSTRSSACCRSVRC